MNHFPLRRVLSSAVCFSIVLACPGLAPYAAAQSIRTAPAAAEGGIVAVEVEQMTQCPGHGQEVAGERQWRAVEGQRHLGH